MDAVEPEGPVPVPAEVLQHYELIDEGSRITKGLGRIELLRTQEILRRHLPAGSLRILDVGGATGVHATWLAGDGHDVHVVDLAARHIEQLRARTASSRITTEVGDARSLAFPDRSFDAALVFGPLYHLTERADRVRALAEAGRVVRPGGLIFVAAISRFASLFDGLAQGFLFDPEFRDIVDRDLLDGQHRNPTNRPEWFTTAYFHRPEELADEARHAGLEVVEVVGVEGMAGWLPQLEARLDADSDRETMLFCARVTEAEPALLALSAHLVLVARTPGENAGA